MNSEKFAFSLGVFLLSMMEQCDVDDKLFDRDVMAVNGILLRRHERETRLKNKTYAKALIIGASAYYKSLDKAMGVTVSTYTMVRLIQMKYADLLQRVYKIDEKHFINLKNKGVQNHTMASVKVTNVFLKFLEEEYENLNKKENKNGTN